MTGSLIVEMTRKLRAFKRWMKWQGMDCSDALLLTTTDNNGVSSVSVRCLCDLHEGDVVARIPKESCLTIKTSRARRLIEEAGLDGALGLAVAIMFERSLGPDSSWFHYLQLLPYSEPIPLLWSSQEIDSLLMGTELHKTVKEDKAVVSEDWKECIQPLLMSAPLELKPEYFGTEQYFAAKSLIASRSFTIDDYYGHGMVPLADLFNHKTNDEDVHFTSLSSQDESDHEVDGAHSNEEYEDMLDDKSAVDGFLEGKGSFSGSDSDCSLISGDDPTILLMVMIKDVKAGNEVFNTYGYLGNAALLHRYGFTEANNPFDIVNLDLELVVKWSSSLYSCRHIRRRLSFWRRLDYSGCVSQNSEYFEISFDGEPQLELLVLLYIMLLPDEAYEELNLVESSAGGDHNVSLYYALPKFNSDMKNKSLLLTESVCVALMSLADIRESLYGAGSIEDDIEALNKCCQMKEPKLYHSLMLRVCERRILEKFRSFASCSVDQRTLSKQQSYRKKKRVKR